MRASVLIPHFDQTEALAACLDSLQNQKIQVLFEIIVADNGTPGGLGGLPGRYPDVRFLQVEERGAACARNAAMAVASGDVFAFIDADCMAAADWLAAGLAMLDHADLVGGDVRVTCDRPDQLTPVEAFETVFAFRQRDYIERKKFSVTANLFATRAAAEAIGPFRNGVAEDVDWCRRGDALGFRLAFLDRAIVNHPARRDWSELVSKWDRLIRERWNGLDAHGARARLVWLALSVATALSAAPHLGRIIASQRLRSVGQKSAAAMVLVRIRLWRAFRMASLLAMKGPLIG